MTRKWTQQGKEKNNRGLSLSKNLQITKEQT
jgi:hypothetical protein